MNANNFPKKSGACEVIPVIGNNPEKAALPDALPQGLNARQIHLAAYHEGHTCIANMLLRLLEDGLLVVSDDLDNAQLADARDILDACRKLEQALPTDWLHFSHDGYIGAISRLIETARSYAGEK